MASTSRVPEEVADIVWERSEGWCECMLPQARCCFHGHHLHHRQLRSRGGKHTVANLVLVCRNCHEWIHQNPSVATSLGFQVSATSTPEVVDVYRRRRWQRLHNDGTMTDTHDEHNDNEEEE